MKILENIDTQRIKTIKRYVFETAHNSNVGHIPSSLSCTEILYVLYNRIANITKENAADVQRDRVIVSKEHGRLGQVCVLAEAGLLEHELLKGFIKDGGALGHDIYGAVGDERVAAIDVACGSLGHGPGMGVGMALGHANHNIYVITGDGELQEGSCWEAIMFAGHHKLKNFTLIVDRNYLQIDNFTKNIIDSSSNVNKQIESFGFEVFECGGHDVDELEKAFKIPQTKAKCIIANTIKGKEISFTQQSKGFAQSHWGALSDEEFELAMQEVKE
jgi:transketolase